MYEYWITFVLVNGYRIRALFQSTKPMSNKQLVDGALSLSTIYVSNMVAFKADKIAHIDGIEKVGIVDPTLIPNVIK